MAYMSEEEFWDAACLAAFQGLCVNTSFQSDEDFSTTVLATGRLADKLVTLRRAHTAKRIETLSGAAAKPADKQSEA